ncbi:MAG: glycosyltransferase family 2 protein [Lachnospiraceae bacterium]|jgi:rhamnosyltransferase|nr:glycosyltransferase family 2 protein [Lachnospiraceae bacterium]MEE3437013.1 glycosyltransferase family 2 protein [Lachnospiraceae bacterium]
MKMNTHPTVDVVIPTYHPDKEEVRKLLLRLTEQSVKPAHLLIINTEEQYWDAGITEGIPEAEVFHIRKANFDHAGTRNMGAGFSNADYILFMTQDAIPLDRKLIENLLTPLKKPRVKIAYARQLPKKDCGIIERYTRSFNYPEKSHVRRISDLPRYGIKTYFCSNVCAMYERQLLLTLHGFKEPCIFNEDMIFASRAMKFGYEVAYAAKAQVLHSHNYTAGQQFHRNFDIGVSQAMHPEVFRGIKSESEGKKLVAGTARYLADSGRAYLIPKLVIHSAAKLIGFRLGRMYRSLPESFILSCTSNRGFWSYVSPDETD